MFITLMETNSTTALKILRFLRHQFMVKFRPNNTMTGAKCISLVLLTWSASWNCFAQVSNYELVAAVLIAEAGGEKDYVNGMAAVREVIWNRAQKHKRTEWQIVTARKQFSCLNDCRPDVLVEHCRNHSRWSIALELVAKPPQGNATKSATHYLNPFACTPPKWANPNKFTARIGKHFFYKL